jgi:hypothetical protein
MLGLEGLGSGTSAAMLARWLLFTWAEFQFMEFVDRTLSDFQLACSKKLIIIRTHARSW